MSPVTATIARRLMAAGGILLGKTRTVEVAMGGWGTNQRMGTPHNPWDPAVARTPGGVLYETVNAHCEDAAGLDCSVKCKDSSGKSVTLPEGVTTITGG